MKKLYNSIFGKKPVEEEQIQAVSLDPKADFEAILTEVVYPFFKRLGFRRQGMTFNRVANDIVQVVQIQKSRWNTGERVSFAVNVGFFDETLHRDYGRGEIPKFIKDTNCLFRFRLGQAIDGQDLWYELSRQHDKSSVAVQIARDFSKHLEPLLESHTDFVAVKNLIVGERFYSVPTFKAMACIRIGAMDEAKQFLDRGLEMALQSENGDLQFAPGTEFFIREMAQKYGLELDR